jgi:quinoprotein glucose dehydrogenase
VIDLTQTPSFRRRLFNAAGLAAGLSLALAAGAHAASAAMSPNPKDWSSYLGYESSQYSALDQINKANVGQLGVAWSYSTGGSTQRFNPLVVNGVMYVLGEKGALVALDAATGKELWNKPQQGRTGARGMNYWQSADGKDRRLLFIQNGMLKEVSADTGEPIAIGPDGQGVDLRVGLDGDISKMRPLQTDNPGRVYKDLIIISLPAGAYDFAAAPADIHAYDIKTGKMAWVFHVVPKKGEFGYDTWPAKDHEMFGGVHNWSESTIDNELGIMYIPTGTGRYDFYGGTRKGNDLFGNSILALDAKTGKRLWHFQAVHHDLWDYDFPVAPKLLTIHKDGKDIPIIAQASKQGFLYVLDRRNGKPIWPIVERPVPKSDVPGEQASPTQPFPTLPKPYARQKFTEADINPYISDADKAKVLQQLRTCRNEGIFTPPSLTCTIQVPGHNGGAEWGLVAVDPVQHFLFVAARNLPTYDKLSLDPKEPVSAMPNGGGDVQPYKAPVDFMLQSNSLSAMAPPWSTVTAYDMDSGQIMWQVPDGEVAPLAEKGIKDTGSHVPRGGTLVTGGLVFNGTSSDRKIRARDEKTGKVVWEHDLPAAQEGVPAVYEVGGREYIVVAVGGNGEFSNNLGLPKPDPGSNQYVAFALPAGAK